MFRIPTLRISTIAMIFGIVMLCTSLTLMHIPTTSNHVKVIKGVKIEGGKICINVMSNTWTKVGKIQLLKDSIVKILPPAGFTIKVKVNDKIIIGDYFILKKGVYEIEIYTQNSGTYCLVFEALR